MHQSEINIYTHTYDHMINGIYVYMWMSYIQVSTSSYLVTESWSAHTWMLLKPYVRELFSSPAVKAMDGSLISALT